MKAYGIEASGQIKAPASSPPAPVGSETGWAPEPVWTLTRWENSLLHRDSNFDPSIVKPVISRYKDRGYLGS
jgi:hypothetical protein